MTIQKSKLLESLKLAMPGIETGSAVLQGADSFVFHNGKIFSYNDSISVSVPLEQAGMIEEEVEGVVRAEEFFKIISKLPSDEISFVMSDGSWILKCGKAKATLTLQNFDYENRLSGIEPKDDWIDITDEFISGLGVCRMSNNKTPLSGIYISGNTVISTDGMQINKYEFKNCDIPTIWISDNCVNELIKLRNLIKMQVNGSWVHFQSEDGTIFSIKTLSTDKFPIEKIIPIIDTANPKKDDLHATFPKELFNAIDRAVSFSIDISERTAVRLIISKEKIEVSSERSAGKYNEKVSWDCEINGDFEPITVYVDTVMMEFAGQRSLEFYLMKGPLKNGKVIPRLLFVTENSLHLMSTLDSGDE